VIKFIKCAEEAEFEQMVKGLEDSGVKVLKKYKLTGIFKLVVDFAIKIC